MAGAAPYVKNDGAASSGPEEGLTPQQLASAYGYDPTSGGTGQTVAIVDAFEDPTIERDLGEFDSEYGISPCTKANGCFEKVGQTGSPTLLPPADTTGWSVEISLDVETAHAVCPHCKVLLVEAQSTNFKNLEPAVNEAATLGATEISNSYGGPEGSISAGEQAAYSHPGVVIAAATGDRGYDGWTYLNEGIKPPQRPNLPASLPSVVAVGGTTLRLNEDGSRNSERVWNGNGPGDDSQFLEGASGGGCSTVFAAQPWQQDAPGFGASGCGTKRLDADIAADADPLTGFAIYDSYNCGTECEEEGAGKGWLAVGGTSLSTPLISALYGLAGGDAGVKDPALTLYGHLGDASSLFDVTEGADGFCGGESEPLCGEPLGESPNSFFGVRVDCGGSTACNAAAGFDGPSGVGAPNGLGAFKALAPAAAIAPQGQLREGVATGFDGSGSTDPYPGGSLASYSWSWGDGSSTSSGISPKHTYVSPGEYLATLTVTDNYGFVGETTRSVTVEGKSPAEKEAEAKKKAEEETQLHAALGNRGVGGFQVVKSAAVPDARLASSALQAGSSGVVDVEIICPAGESGCAGTVTLRTLGAVVASAPAHKSVLSLAAGSFDIPGGHTKIVKLRLSRTARALLARAHVLKVRVTILAHDRAGASHTTQALTVLRTAKARRGKH